METVIQPDTHLAGLHRFTGLVSGFAAGFLNAIVARILMRVIALQLSGEGSFSWGGTAVILMFGVLVGPLFGWIYASTINKMRAPALLKGALFGLILLVTLQLPGLYISPEFRAELMAAGTLGFPIFTLMNFSFVLTLAGMVAWLEKKWSRDGSHRRIEGTASAILGLLAFSGLVLLLIEIVGRPLGLMD